MKSTNHMNDHRFCSQTLIDQGHKVQMVTISYKYKYHFSEIVCKTKLRPSIITPIQGVKCKWPFM